MRYVQFGVLLFTVLACSGGKDGDRPTPSPQEVPSDTPSVDSLVADYWRLKTAAFQAGDSIVVTDDPAPRRELDECRPDRPDRPDRSGGCRKFVCNELFNQFGCDDESEIFAVIRACQGNYGDACIRAISAPLSIFNKDDIGEVSQLAQACRHNYGDECVRAVSARLSIFSKDDVSEAVQIGQMCQDAETSCIEFVCERRGSFGCDELSELREISRSCNQP